MHSVECIPLLRPCMVKWSKVMSICIVPYYKNLIYQALIYMITQFYLPPHWTIPAFTPQPQITALWLVLTVPIYREMARLSRSHMVHMHRMQYGGATQWILTKLLMRNVLWQKSKIAISWPFWIGSTPKFNSFFT